MTKIIAKIIVLFVSWIFFGIIISLSLYERTKKTEDDARISISIGYGIATLGIAFVWAMLTLGW